MAPWFVWPIASEEKLKMANAISRLPTSAFAAHPWCEFILRASQKSENN
jgi:hypothetical protein